MRVAAVTESRIYKLHIRMIVKWREKKLNNTVEMKKSYMLEILELFIFSTLRWSNGEKKKAKKTTQHTKSTKRSSTTDSRPYCITFCGLHSISYAYTCASNNAKHTDDAYSFFFISVCGKRRIIAIVITIQCFI